MSFNRFVLPYTQTMEQIGVPNENAYLIFYETDMVTQQTTYSDYLCTVPSTTVTIQYNFTTVQAIQANAAGVFPTIFMPSDKTYYWVLLDETLATLKTENQYSVPPTSTLNPSQFVVFDGNTYIARSSIEIVGTTYAVNTATSWGNIITFNNPNPIAVTIAAPSLVAFPSGWISNFQNIGNGIVTITGGANINGLTTLVLKKGDGASISSDGTIFNAETGTAELVYYNSGALLTVAANAITVTSSKHLVDTSSSAQIINSINGAIADQVLILQSSSVSNTLTINNGAGIKLQNGVSFVASALQDNIVLEYDFVNSWWVELSRSGITSLSPFTKSYDSGFIAYANGTPQTLSHGLGVAPLLIFADFKCVTTEGAYVTGDIISNVVAKGNETSSPSVNRGIAMFIPNGSVTQLTFSVYTQGISFVAADGASLPTLTPANWQIRIRAYA